jgi:two-component system, LytTR family, response regulator
MLKCIIIDDEDHAIELLSLYIKKTPDLKLVYATTDPLEGLNYIHKSEPDLIFLDIHMDELPGTKLVKMLKNKSKVIFTTAHSDYALEAFEDGVLDYLMKPISLERFLKAVQKATEQAKEVNEVNSFFIKGDSKGKRIRLKFEDIEHVEGMKNYVGFHTKAGKMHLGINTFSEVTKTLEEPLFVRIHNSHLIAFDSIHSIEGNEVLLNTQKGIKRLPIGLSFKEHFMGMVNELGR